MPRCCGRPTAPDITRTYQSPLPPSLDAVARPQRGYIITRPPSTASTCPVMYPPRRRRGRPPRCDLLGRPEPPERRSRGDLVLERIRQVLRELGQDEPGRHRVDRDAARRELAGRRLGQPDEPGLRRAVVRLAHLAGLPGHRRDVDDPPAPRLEHRAGDGLGHPEGAEQVRLEDLAPRLLAHPHDQVVAGDARVVDEDVDLAERIEGGLHDALGGVRVRDVALDGERPAPERLDLARGLARRRRRCPCS